MKKINVSGLVQWVVIGFVSTVVVSCGGGGAQKETSGSGDGGDTTTTIQANSAILTSSEVEIKTGATNTATISLLAKDSNNAVVKGATVNFSASGGAISAAQTTTDDKGLATVTIGSGGDLSNQEISVFAEVTGVAKKTIKLNFIGTSLSLSGATSAISGQTVNYTLILKDGVGKSIANQLVELSATNATLSVNSGVSNANGQLTVSLTPTISSGHVIFKANALGASATTTVAVSTVNQQFTSPSADAVVSTRTCQPIAFSAPNSSSATFAINRGGLYKDNACSQSLAPNESVTVSGTAQIYAMSPGPGGAVVSGSTGGGASTLNLKFVATLSKTMTAQSDPAVTQPNKTSVISATVTDDLGYPVEGATVYFSVPTGNASLDSSSGITNTSGIATALLTAGANATGQNGVTVTVTTANLATGSPANLSANTQLTIAASATSIDMGFDGAISKNTAGTAYFIRYTASLSDSSGSPLANRSVVFSRQYTKYYKGNYTYDSSNSIWNQQQNAVCDAEDTNGDGNLTGSEQDLNGNGILDPAGDARLTSTADGTGGGSTTTVQTDASGLATVYVHYLKDHGSWLQIVLKATAIVAGNNAQTSRTFRLPVPLDDVKQEAAPAFVESPFGRATSCSNPN